MTSEISSPNDAADLRLRYDVTAADPEVIRDLVQSTGVFRPQEVDVAVELVDERLAKGEASGYHFVFAEGEGLMQGYACYGPIPLTVARYDLYWIAVRQACQGRGVALTLMRDVERLIRAAGGSRIYIETSGRGDHGAARALYEKCDYRQVAALTDFYAPDDDKIVYLKVL